MTGPLPPDQDEIAAFLLLAQDPTFLRGLRDACRAQYDAHLRPAGVHDVIDTDPDPARWNLNTLFLCILLHFLGRPVPKAAIISFVVQVRGGKQPNDIQPRHLGTQRGFPVYNQREANPYGGQIPAGHYFMAPLTAPKHGWTRHRSADGLEDEAWERKINARDRRCWHCGSQEGKPHLRHPSQITTLEKGHQDPRKPLTIDNCIPLCRNCNQTMRDQYILDDLGQIVGVTGIGALRHLSKQEKKDFLCDLARSL